MYMYAYIYIYIYIVDPTPFTLQALRPERLQTVCTDFITRVLKVDSLSPSLSYICVCVHAYMHICIHTHGPHPFTL